LNPPLLLGTTEKPRLEKGSFETISLPMSCHVCIVIKGCL